MIQFWYQSYIQTGTVQESSSGINALRDAENQYFAILTAFIAMIFMELLSIFGYGLFKNERV